MERESECEIDGNCVVVVGSIDFAGLVLRKSIWSLVLELLGLGGDLESKSSIRRWRSQVLQRSTDLIGESKCNCTK